MITSRFQDIRNMLLIVLVAMSGLMGIDIHMASIPYLMSAMDASKILVQQSISLYLLGLGLSLLLRPLV